MNQKQKIITINRAPVLTLWATVVAERLGFTEDESLTLGKSVAGLTAQSKGRRIGIFKPHEEKPHKAREKERGEEFWIEVCDDDSLIYCEGYALFKERSLWRWP